MAITIKDSGLRRVTETGAQRDKGSGKGRPSLIVWSLIQELSKIMEAGELKYESYNWECGMPLSWYLDSAIRHVFKLAMGYNEENHAPMAVFNLMGFIDTKRKIDAGLLPKKLNDLRVPLTDDEVEKLESIAKLTEIDIGSLKTSNKKKKARKKLK